MIKLVLIYVPEAYHLRREETDWFDKPRDGRPENGQEKRQVKKNTRLVVVENLLD